MNKKNNFLENVSTRRYKNLNFNCCLTFYYSKAFFILFLKRIKSAENESGTYRQTDAEEIYSPLRYIWLGTKTFIFSLKKPREYDSMYCSLLLRTICI